MDWHIKPSTYNKLNMKPLLKLVNEGFWGSTEALVEMIKEKIPSPVENALNKVIRMLKID